MAWRPQGARRPTARAGPRGPNRSARRAARWRRRGRPYHHARRARVERHPRGGVGGRRRRGGRPARAPPPPHPAASGARHRGRRPVRAVRRRPALAGARRRRLHAADVGLPGRLRDAERRSRAPARACARALSGGDRPGARRRRPARSAPAAPARPPRRHRPRRRDPRLVPLAVVLRPTRHGGLPAPAPAGAVPARRRADLRGVRPRPGRLLGAADGAAVVRRPGRRPERERPGPAAHDARARRGGLEGRLGAPPRCPGREPTRRHAVAALRHLADVRPPPRRGRAAPRRDRLELRDCARLRARLSGRALRDRPDRLRDAHRDDPAQRAPGGPPGAQGRRRPAGTGAAGAGMSHAPVDAPNPRAPEDADDDEMPRIQFTRRGVLLGIVFIVVLVAFLYYGLPQLTGLHETWQRIERGDPWWLGLAAVFTVLSFGGYVVLFRAVFVRGGSRIGLRESYQITMAGLAATRLLAAGGAGGVAVTAWALRRSGMERRTVADRTVAFLVLTYVVYTATLVVVGIGLRIGLFPGPDTFALTVVPAVFGGISMILALLLALTPTDLQGRMQGFAARGGRLARLAQRAANLPASLSAGVRAGRPPPAGRPPALLGSIAFWGFNIAVLWASFRAFGQSPPWAVIVMAYFVGMLGNLLPLPGGIGGVDGGMIGGLIAFGGPGGAALVAVLSYRAFAFWLPTIPGAIAYFQLLGTVREWRRDGVSPEPAPRRSLRHVLRR